MTKLFVDLCDRLTSEIPGLALVDIDCGQLARQGESLPIATPAVLLKLSSQSIEEIDSQTDLVNLQITARVVIDTASGETSSITPAQWRDKSLARLAIIDQVTAALRGFSTLEIAPLSRVAWMGEDLASGLYVHNINFSGHYAEEF